MSDEPAYPRTDDLLDLDLVVYAAGLDAARAVAADVVASLGAFGVVTEAKEPRRYLSEALGMFRLAFQIRAHGPAEATRQRLLDFLGDGWKTRTQLERVSDTEAEEIPISEWIEAGAKKKRRRFAFGGVFAATLSGPTTVYRAEDEGDPAD